MPAVCPVPRESAHDTLVSPDLPHRPVYEDLTPTLWRWWHTPLPAYAAALHTPPPPHPEAPEAAGFWAALRAESRRVTGHEDAAETVARTRVVATAHHTTPTNGPGFFASDRIATASGAPVVVLAWSGVALSNTAWSGCLVADDLGCAFRPDTSTAADLRRARADRQRDRPHEAEDRLWLFPARQRDALLYRRPLPARLTPPGLWDDLRPEARALLASPQDAEDYPTWALRTCAAIQRRALAHAALTYLDASRLLADALLRADAALLRRLLPLRATLADVSWFYAAAREKVVPLDGAGFAGRDGTALSLDEVCAGLAAGTVCPGLAPAFLALRCVVGLRCLGSFNQEQYLRRFEAAWRQHGGEIPEDDGPSLIMGRAHDADGREVRPLDRALAGAPLPITGTVGELWAPLLPRLGYIAPPPLPGSDA